MPSEPTEQPPVRVACVGASGTFGLGLANRREECYPAVLGRLLGEDFRVRNFGYSGATAGRRTNEPYRETPSFTAAVRFDPQVVLVALGANDAQHANRSNLPSFVDDFRSLLEEFRALTSKPRLAVALPLPVFEPLPEIDIAALDAEIRPAVGRLAEELSLPLIDVFTPLRNRPELFPDNLHANAAVARIVAEMAAGVVRRLALPVG